MGAKPSSFLKDVDLKRGLNVKQTEQVFDRFDTDRNGVLDRVEANAFLIAWCKEMNYVYSRELARLFWAAFDANKDGLISKAELLRGSVTLDNVRLDRLEALTKTHMRNNMDDLRAELQTASLTLTSLAFDQCKRMQCLGAKTCQGLVFVKVHGLRGLAPNDAPQNLYCRAETAICNFKKVRSPPPYDPSTCCRTATQSGPNAVFEECYLLPTTNPEFMEGFGEGWAFTLEIYDESSVIQPYILEQVLGSQALALQKRLDSLVGAVRLEWGPLAKMEGKAADSVAGLESQAKRFWCPIDMNSSYSFAGQKGVPEVELSVLFVPGWVMHDTSLELRRACHPTKKYHVLTPPEVHQRIDEDFARFAPHIRTGDLLVFRTLDESRNRIAQLLHSATQTISGRIYTHAGIAVVLTDAKGDRRIFMEEALPIEDCTPDFIAQTPTRTGGIFFWDLLTRLHQAYAVVSWCPLRYDLDPARTLLIERFLARQWVRNPAFDKAGMVEAGFLQATQLVKLMSPLNDWQSFFCSEFVGAALRIAQIPELSTPEVATSLLAPGQAAELKCFHPPICLKFVGDAKVASQHALEVQNARDFTGSVQRTGLELVRMPSSLFPGAELCAAEKEKNTATGGGVVVHM